MEKTIVVLGATGTQGFATACNLLKSGKFKVRAFIRSESHPKAKELLSKGAELYVGDITNEQSLINGLKGAYGLFSVLNPWQIGGTDKEVEIGKRIHEIALKQGVQHIVYSSVASADEHTGIPHFDSKFQVEEHLKGLKGLKNWTILRPVYFMENWLHPSIKDNLAKGFLQIPMKGNQRLQTIAVEDIGIFATKAFEGDQFNNKILSIAGDDLTLNEYASALGCSFKETPLESVNEPLKTMYSWFQKKGYSVDINSVKKLHPGLMDFKTWVAKSGIMSRAAE